MSKGNPRRAAEASLLTVDPAAVETETMVLPAAVEVRVT